MKRRDFFTTSAAAGLALGMTGLAHGAEGPGGKDLYVLCKFSFASPEKLEAYTAFVKEAVPAFNRAGIKPVGVFRLFKEDNPKLEIEADPNELWLLLPNASLASISRLMEDYAWESPAAQAILMAPKDNPAYERFESSLLLAFDGMPKLEVPSSKDTRVVQLRIYESHTIERHLKKVAMFNEGGEIGIFRKTGMNPVFFGQALVGTQLPNLTYMLQFDDTAAMDAAWDAFRSHPDWKVLSQNPEYKDTVSRITNLIMRPLPASQI
ncbi:MAG: NIPSNAP family containing protein [Planctomycetaceae bacterium]|nr:NIPSNAP family containing protein [Planctomycetaceae bacterium]